MREGKDKGPGALVSASGATESGHAEPTYLCAVRNCLPSVLVNYITFYMKRRDIHTPNAEPRYVAEPDSPQKPIQWYEWLMIAFCATCLVLAALDGLGILRLPHR